MIQRTVMYLSSWGLHVSKEPAMRECADIIRERAYLARGHNRKEHNDEREHSCMIKHLRHDIIEPINYLYHWNG